jgi:drug/metabolite transporter (DMT)-like permease
VNDWLREERYRVLYLEARRSFFSKSLLFGAERIRRKTMNPSVQKAIKFIVTVGALLGFVCVYWILLDGEWTPTEQPNPNLLTLASTLTGLVSGVVAGAMGVTIDTNIRGQKAIRRKLEKIGAYLTPVPSDRWKKILAGAYVVVYFAVGVCALIFWAGGEDPARPDIIDNLAGVTSGLVVAIVAGFMAPPE